MTVLFTELWVLRVIEPNLIGIWQFAIVLKSYLMITRLGILNAMNRDVPHLDGRGQTTKSEQVLQTAQAFCVINGLLLFCIYLSFAFFFREQQGQIGFAFKVMAIVVLGEILVSYFESVLRAKGRFVTISWIRIFHIPMVIVSLVLPSRFGFEGFCYRYLLLVVAQLFLIIWFGAVRVKLTFRWHIFLELFQTGWRLWIWSYVRNISKTMPRLVLVGFGSLTALGLFAPVNWMFLTLGAISAVIASYFYPQLSFAAGSGERSVGVACLNIGWQTVAFLSPVAIFGPFLIPGAVVIALPEYISATRAMQVALVAGWVEAFLVCTIAFAVLKAWQQMFLYLACALLLRSLACAIGYVYFTDHLLGVSSGILFANILLGFIAWLQLRKIDSPDQVENAY